MSRQRVGRALGVFEVAEARAVLSDGDPNHPDASGLANEAGRLSVARGRQRPHPPCADGESGWSARPAGVYIRPSYEPSRRVVADQPPSPTRQAGGGRPAIGGVHSSSISFTNHARWLGSAGAPRHSRTLSGPSPAPIRRRLCRFRIRANCVRPLYRPAIRLRLWRCRIRWLGLPSVGPLPLPYPLAP